MITAEIKTKPALFNLKDIFFLSILLLICFKLTYSITHIVDLMFADESHYLKVAYHFGSDTFFKDGFIYFLWLKFLALFIPDMLMVYCWNYALLISINPVLMYILFRKLGKSGFTAVVFSIFFQVSAFNVITWPFITRFALIVILLMFIVLVSVKKNQTRYLAVMVGLFILVYVRPEFVLSLGMFAAGSLVYLIYRFIKAPHRRRQIALFVIITLIVSVWVLFIKNPADGSRSVFAFGQHYGANLAMREKLKVDPWMDWKKIMMERFRTDRSLLAALRNNPAEMVKHINANAHQFVKPFFYQVFPYHSPRLGVFPRQVIKYFIILLFFISLVSFVWGVVKRWRDSRCEKGKPGRWIRVMDDPGKFFYFLVLILVIPLLISIFVIYPRAHYMLVLYAVIYIAAIKNFPVLFCFPGKYKYIRAAITVVVLVAIVYVIPYKAAGRMGFLPGKIREKCSYIRRTMVLKQVPVKGDVRLLALFLRESFQYENLKMFLEHRSSNSYSWFRMSKVDSIEEYIRRNSINMIYVDSNLEAVNGTVSEFLSHVDETQWKKYPVNGCKEYLLLNSSQIKNP